MYNENLDLCLSLGMGLKEVNVSSKCDLIVVVVALTGKKAHNRLNATYYYNTLIKCFYK